jgi:hypothetical protein
MNIAIGDRVKHPTLHDEWGPGEVLAVQADGKAVVHFALVGQKTTKGVAYIKLSGPEAEHPLLDGRIRKKQRRTSKPIDELREAFLRLFPGGFKDPEYLRTERDYKLDAAKKLKELLGASRMKSLLAEGDYGQVCKNALAVVNATNLVFPNEKMDLKDGISDPSGAEDFASSLNDLLYGEEAFEARFEAFAHTLERIKAAKWTIATYFPFFAFPKEHMFLKPIVTQRAAEACGFELNYRPELNWKTYETLLKFSETLRGLTADLKPRDMIDLQSFIWCIGERV